MYFLIDCVLAAVYHADNIVEVHIPGDNVSSRQETPQYWGLLFILVGPPGVGKNAIMNTVMGRLADLHQVATATTRSMRPNEEQGREHLFLNREAFQQMIDRDELVEWQTVHEHLYGTPRASVESAIMHEADVIADIEVLGATYLHSMYPHNVIRVFIQPPSVEELINRMSKRGETQEAIELRMRRVDMEMAYAPHCDYLITNVDLEASSEILYSIVLAERSKRAVLQLRAKKNILEPFAV